MLFDTHVHLDDKRFDPDRDLVIQNALNDDVELLLNVGINTESNKKSIELAEKYDFLYASAGFHPHDAEKFADDDYINIKKLLSHKKVVAVGEIGLDYFRNISPQEKQKEVFTKLVRLAIEVKKPIILHTRDAMDDTLSILQNEGAGIVGGVAHCFSGSLDMAKKLIDMNFYISFTGQITFKNAENFVELIENISLEKMLIETDCPYLSPEPFRRQRNVPSYVIYTAKKISEMKLLSLEDVGRITKLNAIKLFRLPIPIEPAIVYPIRDSLYINITNNCTNNCSFCIRYKNDFLKGHLLQLKTEPSAVELLNKIKPYLLSQTGQTIKSTNELISKDGPLVKGFREIVFCGYGEPLLKLDILLKVANTLKDMGVRYIRINTNGQGNLIYGENIAPKLTDTIDEICISLNAPDKETYMKICRPQFGEKTFESVINFIKECKLVIPKVVVTFVDLPDINLQACRELAHKLGVPYKIRKLDVVG